MDDFAHSAGLGRARGRTRAGGDRIRRAPQSAHGTLDRTHFWGMARVGQGCSEFPIRGWGSRDWLPGKGSGDTPIPRRGTGRHGNCSGITAGSDSVRETSNHNRVEQTCCCCTAAAPPPTEANPWVSPLCALQRQQVMSPSGSGSLVGGGGGGARGSVVGHKQ